MNSKIKIDCNIIPPIEDLLSDDSHDNGTDEFYSDKEFNLKLNKSIELEDNWSNWMRAHVVWTNGMYLEIFKLHM